MNLKETELCLGLPGGGGGGSGGNEAEMLKTTGKRGFSETIDLKLNLQPNESLSSNDNTSTTTHVKPPTK